MPNRRLSGIILIALSFGPLANLAQHTSNTLSVAAGLEPALQRIKGDEILEHVRVLASDKFEGRAPGTPGERLTVEYISRQLKAAGMRPGNPDGTFVQKVPLVGYRTTAEIEINIGKRSVPLKFIDDFVHNYPRLAPVVNIDLSGVVFAGYGITASQFKWDDYKNVDVKNKLVLVLSGEPSRPDKAEPKSADPRFFKGDTNTYYSSRDFKFQEAAKRGAAGILVITDPEKARTFSLFQTFARMEGMALKSAASEDSIALTGLVTVGAMRRLLTEAGIDFAEAEKKADGRSFEPIELKAAGTMSINSELREIQSHNVVAIVEGSDPVLKNEYVIYSAHWDHLGKDLSLKGDQIFNGANDNAAGVAQLIEIGGAFAALVQRPKRSVLFIATTAEEKGFLGARYYAQNPLYPLSRTVAAFNLDAGNLFGLTLDLASTGYGNSSLDGVLANAAEMQGRKFLLRSLDNGSTYFASDQIEFAKAGVPAVFPWNGNNYVGKPSDFGEKVWEKYGNERYHKVTDEVMSDWDTTGIAEDARWMATAGFLVAQETKRPTWNTGSEFLWIGNNIKRRPPAKLARGARNP